MAIATKNGRTLVASQTIDPTSAANDITGPAGNGLDLTTALGFVITGKEITGQTPPESGKEVDMVVEARNGTTGNWFEVSRQTGTSVGNTTLFFNPVVLPASIMYARVIFDVTGASAAGTDLVTIEALGHELTSIQ